MQAAQERSARNAPSLQRGTVRRVPNPSGCPTARDTFGVVLSRQTQLPYTARYCAEGLFTSNRSICASVDGRVKRLPRRGGGTDPLFILGRNAATPQTTAYRARAALVANAADARCRPGASQIHEELPAVPSVFLTTAGAGRARDSGLRAPGSSKEQG